LKTRSNLNSTKKLRPYLTENRLISIRKIKQPIKHEETMTVCCKKNLEV